MKRFNEILLAIVVIGLSVAYQVHCAIHGFDLTDEGYLMSIYQWFCTDPEYAQGMGGYPLTCYLGSLLNGLTSGGILAMRLWGVAIVALTELLLYLYLRQHFSPLMVLAGLLIQTIFVAGDPKPFGYKTLTAFFGLLAFMALAEGASTGCCSLAVWCWVSTCSCDCPTSPVWPSCSSPTSPTSKAGSACN